MTNRALCFAWYYLSAMFAHSFQAVYFIQAGSSAYIYWSMLWLCITNLSIRPPKLKS